MDPQMTCDDFCCISSTNHTFCFADWNFTSRYNLTYPTPSEIAGRYAICIPLLLMGVVGNSLTIFLLLKNKLMLCTSVNLFILNMAVADLIHSLNGPIPYTMQELYQFWQLGEVWCYAQTYIQVMVQLVSMTSIAVISLDRMLGIVRPFHDHLKRWQSLLIIAIIWIYATILAIPFRIYKNFQEHQWKDILETICELDNKKLHIWFDIVNIGSFWVPLTLMVISYSTLFYNFKKYTRIKKEHPASLHMKRRVLLMLVILTSLVIVCWVPLQVLEIAENSLLNEDGQFDDDHPGKKKAYVILATVSQYLVYVTPAVNPIVYALMHQNFRRAYRTTFTCCFKGKPRYFLSKSEGGGRPFMWSLRSGVTAIANSLRRKSIRKRVDTRKISFAPPNISYGNTLTIPGQKPNSNGTNGIMPESAYPKKISKDENKSNSICSQCNSIIEENPSEEIISENNNYIINPSLSSHELSFNKENKLNDVENISDVSNTELGTQIQPATDNVCDYVNPIDDLNDEQSLKDSLDLPSL